MGFRIRKSIKLGKNVKLNIGKKGINSVSIGGRGYTKNIGKNGTRTTVTPIKGSGISYTDYKPYKKDKKQDKKDPNKLNFSERTAKNIVNAELRFNDELPCEIEKIPFFNKTMKIEVAATILFCVLGFVQPGFFVFAMIPLFIFLLQSLFGKNIRANKWQFKAVKSWQLSKWQECVNYCNMSLKLCMNESTCKLKEDAQQKIDSGFKNRQIDDKEAREILNKANN